MGAEANSEVLREKILPHQAKVRHTFRVAGRRNQGLKTTVLVGGLGCAKTTTHYIVSMDRAAQTPGGRQLIIMPTGGMVDDVAVPTFDQWLERHKVRHRWTKPSGRTNLYVNVNHEWTEIRFRSGDVPGRIDGGEFCHVGGDEWGQIKKETHQKLRARARGYAFCTTLLTGTPEGLAGPFYDEAEGKRQPGTAVIRARTDDNPFLQPSPEQYIRELVKGYSPAELEAYRNGLFVPKQGRVYWAFQEERNVQPCDSIDYGTLAMGCDFNVGVMHWVFAKVWHKDGKPHIHVFDECIGENTNTFHHGQLAGDRWMEWQRTQIWAPDLLDATAGVTAYTDASGKARKTSAVGENDISHLRSLGFRVMDATSNPFVKDRVFAVNTMLQDGRLLIDPRCEETIKCMFSQGKDQWGEPDKKLGHDHGSDAVGYLVFGVAPNVAPRGNVRSFDYR